MKKALVILILLGGAGWYWYRQQTPNDQAQEEGSLLSGDQPGYQFGQIGSNLNLTDTTGDALASFVAKFLPEGQGEVNYAGPNFVLTAKKYDFGGRTLLQKILSASEYQEAAGQYGRNVGQTVFQMLFDIPGSYGNFVKVVGEINPGFNYRDPATYILR